VRLLEGKTKTQFRAHGRGTKEGKGRDGLFTKHQPQLEEEKTAINTQCTNSSSFVSSLELRGHKSLKTTNEII
jgi:hypothetical protein